MRGVGGCRREASTILSYYFSASINAGTAPTGSPSAVGCFEVFSLAIAGGVVMELLALLCWSHLVQDLIWRVVLGDRFVVKHRFFTEF